MRTDAFREFIGFMGRHRSFLGFGVIAAASASFGQTWFVSLFAASLREEFGLSHGGLGLLYSIATVASGIAIIWVGRLIDRVRLVSYCMAAYLALALGCLGMAVTDAVGWLAFALFVLRLSGQGALSHLSQTSAARHFQADRGKALSVVSLGFPAAEAVLPAVTVATIAVFGWRGAWLSAGALAGLVLLPGALLLLRAAHTRAPPQRKASRGRAAASASALPERDWSRSEVLRDPRFRLVLPALLATPFISTGVMFHQVYLATTKGWALEWLAACYLGYAGAKVVGSLFIGPLIDRFTAVRLFPLYLPVYAVALFVLSASAHPAVALVYFALAGLTNGFAGPIGGAFWAERYGLTHLGAIRALAVSIMVLGSALSPVVFGWLIDRGTGFDAIAAASGVYVLGAVALAAAGCWWPRSDLQRT